MKEHELKTWPIYFEAILDGRKRFEARRNDRDFTVGDILVLKEWAPMSGYTGAEIRAKVTYMLCGGSMGIEVGHVVMSICPINLPQP